MVRSPSTVVSQYASNWPAGQRYTSCLARYAKSCLPNLPFAYMPVVFGFGSVTATPRHAKEWVGGVNWYLNRAVRISLDYGNTNFGGGATAAAGGNRPTERALLQRFQINF